MMPEAIITPNIIHGIKETVAYALKKNKLILFTDYIIKKIHLLIGNFTKPKFSCITSASKINNNIKIPQILIRRQSKESINQID